MTSQTKPIDLYYFPTPNGKKISVMLEELGVPYTVHHVHIGRGDQFKPEFLAISPNNRIPAIVDPEGPDGEPISIFESGAILQYLGDKFGRFYPADVRKRTEVNQWLMWQMGGFGPMLGQNHHFVQYAPEKIPYAIDRYVNETRRLYRVLNTQLEGRNYICGEFSIADIACIGWALGHERQNVDIAEFPNVRDWIARMQARPGVAAGLAVKGEESKPLREDDDAKKVLFGQR
ncbi:MAG: glutathione S-transferase N-terminal domain-containing protein [Hyphomicrobiaceae bacterium]|nr:glutathione S-transferase N-terminal domain-containing protein [Hyphomicrobiaceae bacterium]